jgi:hypothetical protein
MALRSMEIPSQESLDKQLRREKYMAWFINILLLVLGGILGYFGLFDWLGHIIENLLWW